MKQYLEAGKAVSTHGVRGELRFYPWVDNAQTLCGIKKLYLDAAGKVSVEVEIRAQKNMNLLKLRGVDSIEDARKYIERTFYFDRDDVELAPGAFFVSDLLGAGVINADTGETVGRLRDVVSNGVQDIYEIELSDGTVRLVPAVPAFVQSADAQKGEIVIKPIRGLLSDED